MRDFRFPHLRIKIAICGIAILTLPSIEWNATTELHASSRAPNMGTLDLGALACAGAPRDCESPPNFAGVESSREAQGQRASCLPMALVRPAGASPRTRRIALATLSKATNGGSPYVRMDFKSSPLWINSGIWNSSGRSLLLLHTTVRDATILHVSLEDELVRRVQAFSSRTGIQLRPWRIQAEGSFYLLQSQEGNDGSLFLLDSNYSIVRRIRYKNQGRPEEGFIGTMNQWVPTGDGQIVAFGDVSSEPIGPKAREQENPHNPWSTRVIRFSYDWPEKFSTIKKFDENTLSMEFARLGNPIIAAVGGTAYILLAEEKEGKPAVPGIYEVRSQVRRMPVFPEGYTEVPIVNYDQSKPESVALFYRQLESKQVAVGLYGQGNFLYLLTRQPDVSRDGTTWILHRINPRNEQVLGSVVLETKAPHISLIPGEEEWAIVEKGRVEKVFEQQIEAILRVNASWIEERTGGVEKEGKPRQIG